MTVRLGKPILVTGIGITIAFTLGETLNQALDQGILKGVILDVLENEKFERFSSDQKLLSVLQSESLNKVHHPFLYL